MENSIKSASLEPKKTFKLPAGAVIIKKEVRINVEEIENGFLLRKNYDIKWQMGEDGDEDRRTEYEYFTKTWFSKDNPITYKEPKNLADKLD